MSRTKVWRILGIESTKDKDLIKQAYRERLLQTNPEENAEGFMALRNAYEEAINISNQQDEAVLDEPLEKTDMDLWISQVSKVYQGISKRRDIKKWEVLLENDLCNGLDTWLEAREKLLAYLMDNHYLPSEVWRLFDIKFDLKRDQEDLLQMFPKDFIDYVIAQIENEGFIEYDLFIANEEDDIDGYIGLYYSIKGRLDTDDIDNLQLELDEINGGNIYHPFIEVEKLRYYGKINERVKIEASIQKLSDHMGVAYIAHYVGIAHWDLKRYDEAGGIWERICQQYPLHYGAKLGLLEYYIYKGQYKKTNEEALELLGNYKGSTEVRELLVKANELLIEEYKETCKKEPDNIEVMIELAWCYYQNTYYDQCFQTLEDLPEDEKKKGIYFKLHGYIYLRQENPREAIEYFLQWLEVIQKDKSHKEYEKDLYRCNYMLGLSYVDDEEFEKAILYLEEVIRCDEKEEDLLEMMERLAYSYLKLEKYEECVDQCNQIIKKVNNYYPAYLYRQEAYFNMKNAQEVINDYYNAIEIVPNYIRPYLFAIRVYDIYEENEDAREVINKAKELELSCNELEYFHGKSLCLMAKDEGEKQEAMQVMEAVILQIKGSNSDVDDDEFKDEGEVLQKMARVYADVGWLGEGLSLMNRAIAYRPSQSEFHLTKAYFYMELDQEEDGAKILEEQTKLNGGTAYSNCSLGEYYEKNGRYDKALASYQKTLEINPDYLEALEKIVDICKNLYWDKEERKYYDMGNSHAKHLFKLADRSYYFISVGLFYAKCFELEEALKCYEKAKECSSEEAIIYNNAGAALKDLGRIEEAINELKKSITLMEPNKIYFPYRNLASCYEIIGDYEEALKNCQEILKLEPKALWVEEWIAKLYRTMGQYEKAISSIEQLAREYPDYQKDGYVEMLRIYELEGNLKQAKTYAKKLKSIDYNPRACGDFYYRIGEFKTAAKFIKKALKQDMDSMETKVKLSIRLAEIYYEQGKREEAKTWASNALKAIYKGYGDKEKYISFKPFGAARHKELGMIYLMLKDYENAKKYLKEASHHILCKDCEYKKCNEVFFELGRLYEAKEHFILAEEYYKKALEYGFPERILISKHFEYVKKAREVRGSR